ncbi:MAG: hypothetical protein K0S38_268 [Candidatus Paceibacter sp.]|jgi:hypothetical protein|nr:hypothetical protein [Candidatus Paceibacter sp.]
MLAKHLAVQATGETTGSCKGTCTKDPEKPAQVTLITYENGAVKCKKCGTSYMPKKESAVQS